MKKIFTLSCTLMKICSTQGLIAILLTGMTWAHTNHAQVLDRVISLSITDASLDETIQIIASHAQVKFAYSPEQLSVQDRITLRANEKSVREVLDEILVTRNIQYALQQDGLTISLKRIQPDTQNQKQSPQKEDTNNRTIYNGVVKDTGGQSLAGVNILIKGTTNGTTTNANGQFAIEAEVGEVLVFSFIGFTTQEIRLSQQTTLDIALVEESKSLGSVTVNAGYWEVNRKEQTGNISSIAAVDIEKQNVNNPLQALQGRLTGVYIQQTTGVPGGGFNIQIRGQNSLRTGSATTVNGNLPLYLIDGIPFTSESLNSGPISSSNLKGGNPLSTLNPNDIESIEVLKDADATAIYGSRGANGVVLITTKKAKAGATKVNLQLNQGVSQVGRFMDLLSTPQYIAMRKEALINDGIAIDNPTYTPMLPDLLAWDTTRYTNWQKVLIGNTGHITNANVTVSGGSANTQFLFGGGVYRETTVFKGDNVFLRGSGKLNVNHTSENRKFRFNSSVSFTTTNNGIPNVDFTALAVTLAPNAPQLYTETGQLNWENSTWTNPLSELKRKYSGQIQNLVTSTTVNYEIFQNLNFKTNLGYTSMSVDENIIYPLSARDPDFVAGGTGFAYFGDSKLKTWIAEPQLDYKVQLSKGTLLFLVGSTFQESVQSGKTVEGSGFSNDALLDNIRAAAALNIMQASYSKYRYTSGFARANFNWDEKYIFNLTARRDGSSRFGPGNKFANFGAIGAAWIFSNEKFFPTGIISFGKLRSSYGTTGSDAIGDYQYLNTYGLTTYPYNGSTGLVINRLANPQYSWESNRKFEVALELAFLKDQISIEASYYQNRSTNQLVGLPLPIMTGQSSVQFNLPATVENTGLEFQTSAWLIKKSAFQWEANFNITIPANRLIEFPDLEKFPAYATRYDVGKSVFTVKGFQSTSVDPATGLFTIADLNEDGVISNSLDIVGLKQIAQQYFGGFGNTFRYKGIDLTLFFQFVKQTGNSYHRSFTMPGTPSNQPVIVLNRWQQPGDQTSIQRFSDFDPTAAATLAYSRNLSSDDRITDASFMRFKTAALSWQLPTTLAQRLNMQKLRVYVQGQNLFTITNYLGLDPENQVSVSLPALRMITAGIDLTF